MAENMGAVSSQAGPPAKADEWTTHSAQRFLAASGITLIAAAVFAFGTIVYIKFVETAIRREGGRSYDTWLQLVSQESGTFILLIVAIVAAALGKRLLTTVQLAGARTIPVDDLPLIRQAVIDGKPEPVDQYVRLRALTGVAGTFTKLGITGLPLTTVALTLIFALISLMPLEPEQSTSFLDLAKLTLGAFIGSFVQRQVEQRRQDVALAAVTGSRRPELPT